jgi:hypothetical protein
MSATLTLEIEQSFVNLQTSTINILEQAFALSKKKEELNRNQYRRYLESHNWSMKVAKVYIQVAKTFDKFIPEDLAEIEPNTIFTLAKHSKKYAPVIQNILETGEISQTKVSEWMDWVNAQRPQREGDNSIWRLSRDGRRYAVLGNIWDQELGVVIQRMIDEEGITSQKLVGEAISLLQAVKEGRIIIIENQGDLENNIGHIGYPTNPQNLETQNLETQNLETQNLETQNLETQNLETQNLETQNLEIQNLETQNLETQNLETQNPEIFINDITATGHNKDISENVQPTEEKITNIDNTVDNQQHTNEIIDATEVQKERLKEDNESHYRASTIDVSNDVSSIYNSSNVDEDYPSPEEIVQILLNCTNWEEVIWVTEDFPKEVKEACWELLDSNQRARLHNLKKQYHSNFN